MASDPVAGSLRVITASARGEPGAGSSLTVEPHHTDTDILEWAALRRATELQ
ncbi:hypothetical protein MO867_15650 [Microbulbifer sp. OS29]|uniref:Uncharacterized protein n=1 Tax=Microbulbifer okhotskensis TaxID=2926617 RepID=A0A9X2EQ39_9GAMM|nr:hypothetical protein [Microbulbifer okhotskensis]MCO1335771.1 hypothetical protein [Microbulbifer okhotskensis]